MNPLDLIMAILNGRLGNAMVGPAVGAVSPAGAAGNTIMQSAELGREVAPAVVDQAATLPGRSQQVAAAGGALPVLGAGAPLTAGAGAVATATPGAPNEALPPPPAPPGPSAAVRTQGLTPEQLKILVDRITDKTGQRAFLLPPQTR